MNKQCEASAVRRDLRAHCDPDLVAKLHGVSKKTVYRHGSGMNLKLLREIDGDREIERQIVKAMKQVAGFSNKKIARTLGVTQQYISQVLNELQKE